jgi:hypothetical protein
MTEDFIESMFSDVDQYYPGSKRKRKEKVEPKREIEPKDLWDKHPRVITLPNGKGIEMFTIGALAEALGRPIITIRSWIKEGHLPASPYRLPASKNANGELRQGNRLYSRTMVEKAIEMFEKAGLLYVKRIDWPAHKQLSAELAEAWSNIRADETK